MVPLKNHWNSFTVGISSGRLHPWKVVLKIKAVQEAQVQKGNAAERLLLRKQKMERVLLQILWAQRPGVGLESGRKCRKSESVGIFIIVEWFTWICVSATGMCRADFSQLLIKLHIGAIFINSQAAQMLLSLLLFTEIPLLEQLITFYFALLFHEDFFH